MSSSWQSTQSLFTQYSVSRLSSSLLGLLNSFCAYLFETVPCISFFLKTYCSFKGTVHFWHFQISVIYIYIYIWYNKWLRESLAVCFIWDGAWPDTLSMLISSCFYPVYKMDRWCMCVRAGESPPSSRAIGTAARPPLIKAAERGTKSNITSSIVQ